MVKRLWNYIVRVFWKTVELWQTDDGFLLSAAMAYYAAFSLFPLCLVLISILGFVLRISQRAEDAQAALLDEVAGRTSPWLADQLRDLLAGVKSHAGFSGPISAVAAVLRRDCRLPATRLHVRPHLRGAQPAPKPTIGRYLRTVLYDRLSAFAMLAIVLLLLVALFVANLVYHGTQEAFVKNLPLLAKILDWSQSGGTVFINGLLLGMIYRFLPKVRIRWRDAFVGGLLVSVIWLFGQRLLVRLLIGPGYTAYGIVGTFIAVMIWVYYVSAILFLGAEFIEALAIIAGRATKAKR